MKFKQGDIVEKTKGDYSFYGVVLSVFKKLDGKSERLVAENQQGICHIFHENQLDLVIGKN